MENIQNKEEQIRNCKTCLLNIVPTEACIDCRNYDTWIPRSEVKK